MEESPKSSKHIGVWLFGIAYALLLTPLLWEYIDQLLGKPFYKWVPIYVVVLVVAFFNAYRKAPVSKIETAQWTLITVLLCTFLLTVVAYLYYAWWVIMVSALVAIGALFIYLSGFRKIPHLLGLWGALFLLVRLPDQVERRLLGLFEGFSTKIGSVLIDYSGTYHVMQSDLMVIGGYELNVERICNGYFSILTMAAVAALYAFWRRRTIMHSVGLIVVAVIVAASINVLRVAVVGIVYAKTGVDIMQTGWLYALLFVSLFLGTVGIVSVDAFLTLLLQPIERTTSKLDGSGLARLWNWVTDFKVGVFFERFCQSKSSASRGSKALVVVCCSGVIGLCVFEGLILNARRSGEVGRTRFMHDKSEDLANINPVEVSFTRAGWEVLSFEEEVRKRNSLWGANSFIWKLQYRDVVVIMALDYPFDKWHDVRVCYTNLGWKIQTMAMSNLEQSTGWGASETQMTLPTGDYGFILCSHMDHLGNKVVPKPTASNLNMVGYYLHPKQWQAPFKINVDKDTNTFYQTQVMVTTAFPLDEPTKQEIRDMYGEFREQTRKLIEEESKK